MRRRLAARPGARAFPRAPLLAAQPPALACVVQAQQRRATSAFARARRRSPRNAPPCRVWCTHAVHAAAACHQPGPIFEALRGYLSMEWIRQMHEPATEDCTAKRWLDTLKVRAWHAG